MTKINKWFAFADEDWLIAKQALETKIYNQVCFHAQQGVEKLLKGFLHAHSRPIPKTHSLAELIDLAPI